MKWKAHWHVNKRHAVNAFYLCPKPDQRAVRADAAAFPKAVDGLWSVTINQLTGIPATRGMSLTKNNYWKEKYNLMLLEIAYN